MKILTIADEESKSLWDYYDPERLRGIDLILSAGDLSSAYLEFLVTLTNCPLLYVRGNHDSKYEAEPPGGCICIEDTIYNYKGLRILGLGGCMRYNTGSNQYTENDMKRRVRMAEIRAVLMNGLMTHSCGTTIVNSFDHQIIDFPESNFPARGQTGSPLYDLYISLQERRRI